VFSAAENSNKFQKTRFCNEESIEDVITLGPMAQATLIHMIDKYIPMPPSLSLRQTRGVGMLEIFLLLFP